MPLVMRLTVVSWPAISNSRPVATTSWVDSPSSAANPDSSPVPGSARNRSTSSAMYWFISAAAWAAASCCPGRGSSWVMIASAQGWKRGSSSCGTPSCLQITVTGSG